MDSAPSGVEKHQGGLNTGVQDGKVRRGRGYRICCPYFLSIIYVKSLLFRTPMEILTLHTNYDTLPFGLGNNQP